MKLYSFIYIDDDVDNFHFFSVAANSLIPGSRLTWLPSCDQLPPHQRSATADIIFMNLHRSAVSISESLAFIRDMRHYNRVPVVFYHNHATVEATRHCTGRNVYLAQKGATFIQLKEQLAQFFSKIILRKHNAGEAVKAR